MASPSGVKPLLFALKILSSLSTRKQARKLWFLSMNTISLCCSRWATRSCSRRFETNWRPFTAYWNPWMNMCSSAFLRVWRNSRRSAYLVTWTIWQTSLWTVGMWNFVASRRKKSGLVLMVRWERWQRPTTSARKSAMRNWRRLTMATISRQTLWESIILTVCWTRCRVSHLRIIGLRLARHRTSSNNWNSRIIPWPILVMRNWLPTCSAISIPWTRALYRCYTRVGILLWRAMTVSSRCTVWAFPTLRWSVASPDSWFLIIRSWSLIKANFLWPTSWRSCVWARLMLLCRGLNLSSLMATIRSLAMQNSISKMSSGSSSRW